MKKKLKIKKILAGTLALMTALSMNVTAYAESIASDAANPSVGNDPAQNVSTEYQEPNAAYDKSKVGAQVYLTNDTDNVLVSVPKKVILSGKYDEVDKKYKGEYQVKVTGDFAGNKAVHVTPDSNVVLTQKGKKDKIAIIKQEKTQFVITDVNNNTNLTSGLIEADKLSAGSWNGIFNIEVSIGPILDNAESVRFWEISATPQDDVWMTYYQPNQQTVMSLNSFEPNTTLDKYEDGTVIITGNGDMEENINKYFHNLDQMTLDANNKFWEVFEQKVTPEEYQNALNVIGDEKDKIIVYEATFPTISARIIGKVDGYNGKIGTIMNKCVDEVYPTISNAVDKYTIYDPKIVQIEEGVTNISKNAFAGCKSIQSFRLPKSVVHVGEYAFANCSSLKTMYFTNFSNIKLDRSSMYWLETMVIEEEITSINLDKLNILFRDSDLKAKYLKLPNSINKIEGSGLRETMLIIPEENEYYLSDEDGHYIYDKVNSKAFLRTGWSYAEPNYNKTYNVVPGTKIIGEYGLWNIGTRDIVLPRSVTTIEDYGFDHCSSHKIFIPSTVTKISPTAFANVTHATIVCETEEIANMIQPNMDQWDNYKTTVVVDSTQFV